MPFSILVHGRITYGSREHLVMLRSLAVYSNEGAGTWVSISRMERFLSVVTVQSGSSSLPESTSHDTFPVC